MIVHNFDPVLIDFGFFELRWYSLAYILGILLGWLYALKIIQKTNIDQNHKAITTKMFDDLIVYLIIGIIIGGRLGYVFFYDYKYYIQNISEIVKIWNGGMSFHGGLLGTIAAIYIFAKRNKVNFFHYSDIIACAAPIGLFLGRIANFINGELFGKVSSAPWAIVFPTGNNIARHPSQIYEALLEGVVLFLLINFFAVRKKLLSKPGYVSSLFLIFYSIFRIFSENFREPDEHIGYILKYFSMGTILSLITLFAGSVLIFLIKKNERNY